MRYLDPIQNAFETSRGRNRGRPSPQTDQPTVPNQDDPMSLSTIALVHDAGTSTPTHVTHIPNVTTGPFWWCGISIHRYRPTSPFMSLEDFRGEPAIPKTRLISSIVSANSRDVLRPDHCHVALEQSVHPPYWTEKRADPLLGRCVTSHDDAPSTIEAFPNGTGFCDRPFDSIKAPQSTTVEPAPAGRSQAPTDAVA
jgi:hypothetical protein